MGLQNRWRFITFSNTIHLFDDPNCVVYCSARVDHEFILSGESFLFKLRMNNNCDILFGQIIFDRTVPSSSNKSSLDSRSRGSSKYFYTWYYTSENLESFVFLYKSHRVADCKLPSAKVESIIFIGSMYLRVGNSNDFIAAVSH